MDELGCFHLWGSTAMNMVVQIAVRVPAFSCSGYVPGSGHRLCGVEDPFLCWDCWNHSLAAYPSDAAFVFYPSPFAHGKVLDVPRPGFVTSWRATLSLSVVLGYEDRHIST